MPGDNESGENGDPNNSATTIRINELHRDNVVKQVVKDSENISQYNELTIHQLDVKLSLLERHFESFENVQWKLEAMDEAQFNGNHRTVFENAYFNIKSRILERISHLRVNMPDPMMNSTRIPTSFGPQHLRPALPTLQLSKFSGDYSNWTEFYNMFCLLVHNNADLSIISKFQYLRSCLTDEAARLIQSLEMTPHNYNEALDILKLRYDNKRFIFQSHIEKIFAIKHFTKPTVSEVRDFIDSANAHLRALKSIATKDQIASGIMLHMMISKLDADTQTKWEEEIFANWDNNTSSEILHLPEWKDLATFLERRCKTLHLIANNATKQQSAGPHGRSLTQNQSSSSKKRSASSLVASNQTSQCFFCKTTPSHNAFHCSKFIEMNVIDRFRTAKRLNLCLNCLGSNHIATACPSSNRCQHCNSLHHTLLHKPQSSPPPPTSPPHSSSTSPSATTSSVGLHVSEEDSPVILGTARVELHSSNGRSIMVRALLDSGSQLHFMTEHIAQYLRVPRTKVNMEVSGIATSTTSAYNSCSIIVKSLTTGFSAPLNTIVIPSITSYQPQTSISTKNWNIPGNINLADITFNSPGPIDLLIGASLFYDLLLVGQIKNENTPILQKTKLGWVVAGSSNKSKHMVLPNMRSSVNSLVHAKSLATNSPQSTDASHNLIPPLSSNQSKQKPADLFTFACVSPPLSSNQSKQKSADLFTFACMHVSSQPSYNSLKMSKEPLLEILLERFWKIEECPSQSPAQLSSEEAECEKLFEETTTRCKVTNKFIVRLPFKICPTDLGSSLEISRRRFYSLEKKLQQNPNIRKDYNDFIREYIDLKHMVQIPGTDATKNYIPHHCVIKPDSSTTRLRVVFDASCRTSNGLSLNNTLRVGPTLQEDIVSILTRFRFHKFVLVADIAKMYRQVLVDEQDCRWQCILWRNNPNESLSTYKLKTITYGTSCAPYLAVKCLQVLAMTESSRFPIGAAATLRDFYVDNLMTGSNTIKGAIEIKRQVTDLLKEGGFSLRKFAANNEHIIADVPASDREDIIKVDDTQYIKTLGLKWSPEEDSFSYSYNQVQGSTNKITKRVILSHIAKLFDPLGLVNPIVVRCKMLLQNIWALKLHWDETVPQDVIVEWEDVRRQLVLVTEIKLPRFVAFNNYTNIHAFADASLRAYGACIYAVTNLDGKIESSLLCSKSRVAPLKTISLPRLELCAALLLTQLLQSVLPTLPTSPRDIMCWSDSTITLCWIDGEPSRWNTFVANRVTKINQNCPSANWRHIPSELNPADILSRGTTVSHLIDNKLWFSGPQFLLKDRQLWPTEVLSYPEEEMCEVRKIKVTLVASKSDDFLINHKYVNNYEKIMRIFAYVSRFLSKIRKQKSISGPIEVNERNNAFDMVCRVIQKTYFSDELRSLQSNKQVDRRSKLSQLSPFVHNGIIRVGGRLENSNLSFSVKHPILLPASHLFVHTIIRHFHRQHLHAGALTLHNILRENLWIINAKRTIRQIIHNCVICYRCRPVTEKQIMGALPTDRVSRSYPFAISGVDYCGPFQITQQIRGRPPTKVYIAVFICFSVKAVHLELVPDLTSNAFIAALKRFIARRGRCATIYSDNATNFIGANRELKELLHLFLSEDHNKLVRESCYQLGIEWKFIPPRSPHFGGLWESAVKQAKHHIRRAVGTHILTFDELHTVICQAEAIINSRPLTAISSDPNDLRPLTPAHFLIGRPLTTVLEPSTAKINPASLKRYHILRWIHQHFWDRWHNEYLKSLQQKPKWNLIETNLQPNDLVLIKDESTPPLKWPLGRIIATSPGEDGRVRVVTVRTAEGTYKRAVTKLCKLPIESKTLQDVC